MHILYMMFIRTLLLEDIFEDGALSGAHSATHEEEHGTSFVVSHRRHYFCTVRLAAAANFDGFHLFY